MLLLAGGHFLTWIYITITTSAIIRKVRLLLVTWDSNCFRCVLNHGICILYLHFPTENLLTISFSFIGSFLINHKWTLLYRDTTYILNDGIFLIIKSSLHQSLMIYLPKHFTTEHINNYQVIKTTWKGTWKYFSHNIGRQQRAEAARTKVWLLIRQVAVSFYFLCLDVGVIAPNSLLRLSCDFLIPGSS